MTISWLKSGTAAFATTAALAVPYATGVSAGALWVLVLNQKPSTVGGGTVTTPSGWTFIASVKGKGGYNAVPASDTGDINQWVYVKTATGSESGSLTVTHSGSDVIAGIFGVFTTTATWGNHAAVFGDRTTGASNGTPIAVTSTATMPTINGDYLYYVIASSTDTLPSWATSTVITASLATVASTTGVGLMNSSNGNDIGGLTGHAGVIGGGNVNGTFTWNRTPSTNAINFRGPVVFVRLRDQPDPATHDCTVWNGTTEVPANITVWNGSTEVAANIEFVP